MSRVDQRQLQVLTVIGLCIFIVAMTIAYAVMSSTLSINGSAKMESASWDIHFANVTSSSIGDASFSMPHIQDTTLNDFDVTLTKPGDSVTYSFSVVNDGNMSARLTDIVKNEAKCNSTNNDDSEIVCNNFNYKLTYSDGSNIEKGDILTKDSSVDMKLTVEYPISVSSLPDGEVAIDNLGIMLIYTQE